MQRTLTARVGEWKEESLRGGGGGGCHRRTSSEKGAPTRGYGISGFRVREKRRRGRDWGWSHLQRWPETEAKFGGRRRNSPTSPRLTRLLIVSHHSPYSPHLTSPRLTRLLTRLASPASLVLPRPASLASLHPPPPRLASPHLTRLVSPASSHLTRLASPASSSPRITRLVSP
ncbi:hypothetical protein ACLB2K_043179 [Fragaria x ananassa]